MEMLNTAELIDDIRVVHDRKHTLFAGFPEAGQGYPGQGSEDIMDIKSYQRGLLKDKP